MCLHQLLLCHNLKQSQKLDASPHMYVEEVDVADSPHTLVEVHNKQYSLHAKQKKRKLQLPINLLISLLNKTSRIKWINLPGSSISPEPLKQNLHELVPAGSSVHSAGKTSPA